MAAAEIAAVDFNSLCTRGNVTKGRFRGSGRAWAYSIVLSADVQTPVKNAVTMLSDFACLLVGLYSGPRGGVAALVDIPRRRHVHRHRH